MAKANAFPAAEHGGAKLADDPGFHLMSHRFECRCGALQGEVRRPAHGVRAVCYCGDCQTYAHLLGNAQSVLDALGGTDVVATQARNVVITSGASELACLSLSPNGLLRWYAKCCKTPIANTPRNWKMPYVGLVHTCLSRPEPIEQSFPKVRLRVNTKGAKGQPPKAGKFGFVPFAGLALRLTGAMLSGGYRNTPFFDSGGAPITEVLVASRAEVAAARQAAQGK